MSKLFKCLSNFFNEGTIFNLRNSFKESQRKKVWFTVSLLTLNFKDLIQELELIEIKLVSYSKTLWILYEMMQVLKSWNVLWFQPKVKEMWSNKITFKTSPYSIELPNSCRCKSVASSQLPRLISNSRCEGHTDGDTANQKHCKSLLEPFQENHLPTEALQRHTKTVIERPSR
jgi:hypothetical protein